MVEDIEQLCSNTRFRLQNRPRPVTYERIAKETGLPKRWLNSFAQQKFGKPHLRYVRKLHAWLVENIDNGIL